MLSAFSRTVAVGVLALATVLSASNASAARTISLGSQGFRSPTVDAAGLVAACAEKYKAARDGHSEELGRMAREACENGLKQSGLSADEFWARIKELIGTTAPKPTQGPGDSFTALLRSCVEAYLEVIDKEAGPDSETANKARYLCARALSASGMSADDFWAKVQSLVDAAQAERRNANGQKPAPPTPPAAVDPADAANLLAKCAEQYRAVAGGNASKDDLYGVAKACREAMQAIERSLPGLLGPQTQVPPTTEAPTATPTPAPTDGTATSALIAECIRLRNEVEKSTSSDTARAVSEACSKAIRTTGLRSADFWQKYGTTGH